MPASVSIELASPGQPALHGHAATSIRGGRADVRKTRCVATPVAVHQSPVFKAFCERLVTTGKRKKVAPVATMRTLLTTRNALAR